MTAVVVVAKACLPGRVKTRLTPPFNPEEAAQLAAAALDDTLAMVTALPVSRRILFFAGAEAPNSAAAFDVVSQPPGSLDERLAWLFDAMREPTLLIGMDTPQLTAAHVAPAIGEDEGPDCWFGPADDGGFWALAMRKPRGDVLRGVPMSRVDTGARQLERLRAAGLEVGMLAKLVDVDTAADAAAVADTAPGTRFSHRYRSLAPAERRSGALR
jgi:glycosyltransferase A (GT-A) superfamily protein (DUF2064 family)